MFHTIKAQRHGQLSQKGDCHYPKLVSQSPHTEFAPDAFMKQLLAAEAAERTVRSMAYQMGAARFPMHRDLTGFDFAVAQVDETLVSDLHQATFIVPVKGTLRRHRTWC